jgi:hypothetical protein
VNDPLSTLYTWQLGSLELVQQCAHNQQHHATGPTQPAATAATHVVCTHLEGLSG